MFRMDIQTFGKDFRVATPVCFREYYVKSSLKIGIRCTFRFNAGSRITKNNLRECFSLFLVTMGGSNPVEIFPNPRGAKLTFT